MKKTILSLAFSCILTFTTQAQGLYLGGSLGYGFRAGSTNALSQQTPNSGFSQVKYSYGTGFTPNISVGYLFNKNMGVELGLGYLIGKKTTLQYYGSTNETDKLNANSFYLNPSFVIRGGDGKIVPYGKMGVFIGLANKETTDRIETYSNSNLNSELKLIEKGGISTGITAAFGVDFKMSGKFALYGELFSRLASYSPRRVIGQTTQTITKSDSFALPLSAVGFNVGVRYYLGKN